MPPVTDDAAHALDALRREVEVCSGCGLCETRGRVVFGEGDPGAELMFVGEAPGYHEDQQGRPFVGQAGKLLEQLLASIGLTREQVFIGNVLKCRPPNNRDPRPEEIDACRPVLWRQIELIQPKVICTLGNFATKLLSGDQRGITKVHGQPRPTGIAGRRLYLYPIFHPAAALYTTANLATLKEDFLRLPDLLAHAAPAVGEEAAPTPAAQRPAWRPPERLRRPAASGDVAASQEAFGQGATPASASASVSAADPAPAATSGLAPATFDFDAGDAVVRDAAADLGAGAPADNASAVERPPAEPLIEPASADKEASSGRSSAAELSSTEPPPSTEPEQLGLF